MFPPWPFTIWWALAVAVIGAATFTIVVCLLLVKFPGPYQASSNYGLGPGWTCSYPGNAEPVCLKQPAQTQP